ncbi:hypothetical protein [Lacinutrix sp. Bg11-31]|uniref:hypothetical protein n=1 Tax=Lacinutrix sp. Bg11-31 TaxID=2057808 RepID=UPI000C30B332|nr:hypothetical protein [Lacinutrix sp. Bg11-31]AUC81133.1 hypothetical protein CW733_02890 [Lacinutrix sp. Bg11-31]
MNTNNTDSKYIEWISAEEMHEVTKQWLSDLKFIADEQKFFQDLIKNYTIQLVDKSVFADTKVTIDALEKSKNKTKNLLAAIKRHGNDLEILVDGIDQLKEEKTYKKKHREFISLMSAFFIEYQTLKTQLFLIVKKALKKENQQRLL